MASTDTLTLAFLSAHPPEAARVLERLPAADAAALFANVPARIGAPVISGMLPAAAARVLNALDREVALSLLSLTGTQAMVAVLRNVSEPHRGSLLTGLPTTISLTARMLLHYPDDSVGAWVDPDIIALSPEQTVATAMERLSESDETLAEQIFLVDAAQQPVGVVAVHELLRVPGSNVLAGIMHKSVAILTASATISGAARRRGWQQSSALPVIDRSGRLIGVLRRATLERALARHRVPTFVPEDTYLSTMLARGYWDAISGLAEAAVWLLPKTKPLAAKDE